MPSILPNLEGPVRKPASGGPALSLVVFLHGFGADGDDLIGLAPYWAPLLPDTEFLSPHAPYPCEMAPFGRQWFSLQSHAPESMLAGARATAPLIDAFLDDTLVARNLDEVAPCAGRILAGNHDVAVCRLAARQAVGGDHRLFGRAARRRDARRRDPLATSGAAGAWRRRSDRPGERAAACRPGTRGRRRRGRKLLRPGLAHGIDQAGLERGGLFLRNALARSP